VIGVGDVGVDIFLGVDHVPGRDEKVLASREELHPGGMVANFLCALARLGTSCGFHGPLGADEYGRLVLEDLRSNGVDTQGAVVRPGGRTYYCVVLLDASGEKALVVVPTGCSHLAAEELSEELVSEAAHLHTTGTRPATLRAAQLAKKHRMTVSLDMESASGAQPAVIRELLPLIDILFVNEHGLRRLADGVTLEEMARNVLQLGAGTVCVTLGEKGSLAVTEGGVCRTEAYTVPVADSTGAGDCYAAAFVHGFLKGWPLARTMSFASAVGALAVTRWGGHAGAPTSEEALAFIARRDEPTEAYRSSRH
jgi:ribokinase